MESLEFINGIIFIFLEKGAKFVKYLENFQYSIIIINLIKNIKSKLLY